MKDIRAIIAPHAGYAYSGQSAAYAYKSVNVANISRVFILGPSHTIYLKGCALSSCVTYETPLGNIPLDQNTNQTLVESGLYSFMKTRVDEDEHSIEMHLPFIYKIMNGKQFTIVPILVGSLDSQLLTRYAQTLVPFLSDPSNLFVISSDFCHWGQRFSYTYSFPNMPIHESIKRLDREAMDLIEDLDGEGFASYLQRSGNTICGREPIRLLLEILSFVQKKDNSQKAKCHFIHYAQSSQVVYSHDSSVSYACALLKFVK